VGGFIGPRQAGFAPAGAGRRSRWALAQHVISHYVK
jgi:hypothetical protein